MKTIKSLMDITTLEVGDEVVFGNLVYKVRQNPATNGYYLYLCDKDAPNDTIFDYLNINTKVFIENIGINACINMDFPEVKSLEALTAIVSALFKEYEKQNELPKTWEEFCERNPVTPNEYWIETIDSRYCHGFRNRERDINRDKNVCVSLQEATAFTALMQLRQLRKAYVKDWEPDWNNYHIRKYNILSDNNVVQIVPAVSLQRTLSFPTFELASQFLNNFKDLLEIAKLLL